MFKEILSSFIEFDKKWCFFAIDNVCNNRCEMCSIWEEKPKIVSLAEAKKVLDKLHENRFGVVQLTGGEPLMNPYFFKIVKYAKKLGFLVFTPTNGTMIDERAAEKLKESKIDQISISFHHNKADVFEKISGQKNILKKVIRSIEILQKKKLPVSVLCTISRDNMNDIESIVEFVDKLNVAVSFCMPVIVEDTSFKLGGNKSSVSLSKDEMRNVLLRIIRMKKRGHNIVNNLTYLFDTIKYLDGKNRYECFGGSKLLYIDWNLNVYPCMCKGKATDIDDYDFSNGGKKCNKCLIQCFREPSIILEDRIKASKVMIKEIPFLAMMGMKRLKTIAR